MKRRTVRLNLALLGTAILLVYLLVGKWRQFEAEHRLEPPNPGPRAVAGDSGGAASPASASSFAAIVDHHLFNRDRNNDLSQEPPVELPEAPPGPLPILMGTMGIGGEAYALMVSEDSRKSQGPGGLYRRLKAGEALDGYTLVRVEMDRVVMRSGAAEVKIGINDKPGQASARRRDPPRRTATPRRPTGVGSRNRKKTASTRQAPRPTNVPVGTVKDGKRLIAIPTPFGDVKRWVEVKPK